MPLVKWRSCQKWWKLKSWKKFPWVWLIFKWRKWQKRAIFGEFSLNSSFSLLRTFLDIRGKDRSDNVVFFTNSCIIQPFYNKKCHIFLSHLLLAFTHNTSLVFLGFSKHRIHLLQKWTCTSSGQACNHLRAQIEWGSGLMIESKLYWNHR